MYLGGMNYNFLQSAIKKCSIFNILFCRSQIREHPIILFEVAEKRNGTQKSFFSTNVTQSRLPPLKADFDNFKFSIAFKNIWTKFCGKNTKLKVFPFSLLCLKKLFLPRH